MNHIYSLLQTNREQRGNNNVWRNIPVNNSQFAPTMKVKVISACVTADASVDESLFILKCHNRAMNHTSSDNINRVICGFMYLIATDDYIFKNAGLEFLMKTNPTEWEFSLWKSDNTQLTYDEIASLNIVISVEYVDKDDTRENVSALLGGPPPAPRV